MHRRWNVEVLDAGGAFCEIRRFDGSKIEDFGHEAEDLTRSSFSCYTYGDYVEGCPPAIPVVLWRESLPAALRRDPDRKFYQLPEPWASNGAGDILVGPEADFLKELSDLPSWRYLKEFALDDGASACRRGTRIFNPTST